MDTVTIKKSELKSLIQETLKEFFQNTILSPIRSRQKLKVYIKTMNLINR